MKIFVTGTRGIPNIPGGVETHCEHLYPLIAAQGHEVIVARRSSYVTDTLTNWRGVRLVNIFSPRIKALEAIVHTFLSILRARLLNPDIVHIHAVGPAVLIPFARLLGLRVVFTNHGPDYDRQKWGRLAKAILLLGEKLGGRQAHEIIVISNVIRAIVKRRCNRDSHLIYNGVPLPEPSAETDYLEETGIIPGGYILAVARFVPEKGLDDLLAAFAAIDTGLQLVLAGDADHESNYSRELKRAAAANNNIILPGYVTGRRLNQLYSHARLFVLPSYHEGLPIALLEAMSYGLDVLVSDIPANKEVPLPEECFFRCGDVKDLQQQLSTALTCGASGERKKDFLHIIEKDYNWEKIAQQTAEVYAKVMEK